MISSSPTNKVYHLPHDVLAHIHSFADENTRQTLTRVNKKCHLAAWEYFLSCRENEVEGNDPPIHPCFSRLHIVPRLLTQTLPPRCNSKSRAEIDVKILLDGSLVIQRENKVIRFDPKREVTIKESDLSKNPVFLADGTEIYTEGGAQDTLVGSKNGEELFKVPTPCLSDGQTLSISRLMISDDSQFIIACNQKNTIAIFDIKNRTWRENPSFVSLRSAPTFLHKNWIIQITENNLPSIHACDWESPNDSFSINIPEYKDWNFGIDATPICNTPFIATVSRSHSKKNHPIVDIWDLAKRAFAFHISSPWQVRNSNLRLSSPEKNIIVLQEENIGFKRWKIEEGKEPLLLSQTLGTLHQYGGPQELPLAASYNKTIKSLIDFNAPFNLRILAPTHDNGNAKILTCCEREKIVILFSNGQIAIQPLGCLVPRTQALLRARGKYPDGERQRLHLSSAVQAQLDRDDLSYIEQIFSKEEKEVLQIADALARPSATAKIIEELKKWRELLAELARLPTAL